MLTTAPPPPPALGVDPEPLAMAFRSEAKSMPTACTHPTKPPSERMARAVSGLASKSPARHSTFASRLPGGMSSGGRPRRLTLTTAKPDSMARSHILDPTNPVPPRMRSLPFLYPGLDSEEEEAAAVTVPAMRDDS